jgi:hypothetical protein
MPACGPDFQSVLKNHLAVGVAAAAANHVVATAVNTFFSLIHTPAQVTAGGIFFVFYQLLFLSPFSRLLSPVFCFLTDSGPELTFFNSCLNPNKSIINI